MYFYELRSGSHAHPHYYEAAVDPFPSDVDPYLLSREAPPAVVRYKVLRGRRAGDIISHGAWSDRLIEVLKSCSATGYRTHPVEIWKEREHISGYQGVRIIGRGGPLDEERSGVERSRSGGAILGHSAIYIFDDRWDGSDVFTIPGLGLCVFVVERVAAALRSARLKNVDLILNSECRFGTKDPPATAPPGGHRPIPRIEGQSRPPQGKHTVTTTVADPRAVLHLASDVRVDPAAFRSFTARLFSDLTEHVVHQEHGLSHKPDRMAHVQQILQRVPGLIDALTEALLTNPRNGLRILAVSRELVRTCGDSMPSSSVDWTLLHTMIQGIRQDLQHQGMSVAEIEEAIERARMTL